MRTRLLTLVAACGVVLLGLLAASPTSAHAKVHKLAAARVSMDVPSKWKVEVSETQLNVNTKDQSLAISLTHIAGADLDGAWGEVAPAISGMLSSASLGDRKDGVLGGMSGYVMTASGALEGANVSVLAALVRTPRNNLLFVIAIGRVGKYEKHEKDMTKALNSIKGEAPLFNDEGYFQLTPEAQAFAEQVVTLVQKNDQKGFVKLVHYNLQGSDGFSVYSIDGGGDSYTSAKALAKALKKGKKITKALLVPDKGDWHIQLRGDADSFRIWRGEWTDYVTFIVCYRDGGKWGMTEAVTDYAAYQPEPQPEEDM